MQLLKEDLKTIFESCQHRSQTHPKLIKELKAIYEKSSLQDFTKEFLYLLHYSMLSERTNPYSERTLDFVAQYAGSLSMLTAREESALENDEVEENFDPFLILLLEHLANLHDAENTNVRYNACKLMHKILNSLSPEVTISEELYARICRSMLDNVQDKVADVRIQAVHAVARLQDPTDKHCPILKAYIFHMEQDTNPSVRAAIVSCIAASSRTLGPVVNRTRDVKDTVRKAAYLFLANKISLKSLTISQRIRLLKDGLNDRSDMVQKVVKEHLIPAWLKTAEDLISFLGCLDVQGDPDIAQKVLEVHFDKKSPRDIVKLLTALNEEKVVPHDQLACEQALLWRSACQYLEKQKNPLAGECLECIQPELVKFCDYMKIYILNIGSMADLVKRLEHTFISQQLLIIARDYDLTDEAGRRCLDNLVKNLLMNSDVGVPLVSPLIACYLRMHKDVEQSLQNIAEIISEIREPITLVEVEKSAEEKRQTDLNVAKLRVEINEMKEELDNCIQNQDFQRAQEIKEKLCAKEQAKETLLENLLPCSQEVRSEKNDPETLLKCLTLVSEILLQAEFKVITPALYTLVEALLLPGIRNQDPAVRNQAVLALGLTCLLNRNVACQHFVLFLQVSQIDQVAIRSTALKIIIDLLLLYGMQTFQEDEKVEDFVQVVPDTPPHQPSLRGNSCSQESQKAFASLLYILKSQLDSESPEIRSTVAEGLGKLLFNGRICSAPLLSHLILLWYNPATENETFLRHFLGVFLPAFASCSRVAQKCYEEAFMPTMLTILDAPLSSPLFQIDAYNVGKFFLHLMGSSACRGKEASIEETSIHDRLAERICNEILKEPDSSDVRVWSKLLSCLEMSTKVHPIHKDVLVLIEKCVDVVDEKQSVRRLEKFRDTIGIIVKKSVVPVIDGDDMQPMPNSSADDAQNATSTDITLDSEVQSMAVDSQCSDALPQKAGAPPSTKRRGRPRKK